MEFKFPDVAEGIREGKLIEWKVKEGDTVEADQVLCEMETDKSVLEIPSPAKGVISKLHFKSGDTVKVGEVLVTFEGGTVLSKEEPAHVQSSESIRHHESSPSVLALPKDRKLAKELGVDLSKIKGSGPGGRVIREDIEMAKGSVAVRQRSAAKPGLENGKIIPPAKINVRATPSQRKLARERGISVEQLIGSSSRPVENKREEEFKPITDEGTRIKLEGRRALIKKHMETAWRKIPHASVAIEFNADKLVAHRENNIKELEKKGIRLTYLAYILKVAADALENFPKFNASIDETTQEIVLKKQVNIGIAVDTEYGLVVPNIKDCDKKPIAEIAREIQELALKARNRRLSRDDVGGGTFTVTNFGSFGGIGGTAIINHPESALLMTGTIVGRLVPIGKKRVVQKIMPLTLTFDHRIVDGADAARFLNFMIELLSNPQMQVDVI